MNGINSRCISWLRKNYISCIVLILAVIIFLICYRLAAPIPDVSIPATEYAEYETGTVIMILTDNTEQNPVDDGGWRGEQLLLIEVNSGQYTGQTLQVSNYAGPLYGDPLRVGDSAVLIISTYEDGSHVATVFEYNRAVPLCIIIGLFLLVAIAVGGKTGVKSLVGLAVTLCCLFLVLIPALMKGAPTLATVFGCCAFITVVTLTILGGIHKKTLCAMAGTISGTLLALFFGLLAQSLARINGLRLDDVEALLQLRQTGSHIGLHGLLVGGIVISALGAVMDVAMGISSSICEVHTANSSLSFKELFRSGMNIGRDMVGTMTNTLILAFLGSGFSMILYFYSLDLAPNQLLSSAFLSIEVISGISSSIGVILSIPVTALITAFALKHK